MNSFISYRKQLELIRTSLKSETSNEPGVNLLQYCGSEEYYTQIDNCIDILIDFYEKYLNTSSTREKINEVLLDFDDSNVQLCLLIDVVRCYRGMDHSTSFTSPEGIALMLILNKLYKISPKHSFSDLERVNSAVISLWNLVPYICDCSYELGVKENDLILSKILQETNKKIDSLYRMLLHHFCKTIAEADGVVTPAEKEWLEEIAHLEDEDSANDVPIIRMAST